MLKKDMIGILIMDKKIKKTMEVPMECWHYPMVLKS